MIRASFTMRDGGLDSLPEAEQGVKAFRSYTGRREAGSILAPKLVKM